jgi:hypothetical protein
VDTAPSETTRAGEIAIGTSQTGTVTAVVAVMSIFSKNRCKLQSASSGNKKPFFQKDRKIPADQETFLKNQEKARYQRK